MDCFEGYLIALNNFLLPPLDVLRNKKKGSLGTEDGPAKTKLI